MRFPATRVAAAFLLLLASPAAAQQRPDPAFLRLESGQRIRIETTERGQIEGRFERISPDMLSLELTEDSAVPIVDIDGFSTRGNRAGTGLIIGGIIGALAGVGLGYGVCQMDDSADGCNTAAVISIGALAGGGSLGLVGALIGLGVPRWRVQYERSPAQ